MKHNHWAIIMAVIFNQVFSFIWYSPAFFFHPWIAAMGKTPELIDPSKPLPFISAVVGSAMFCYLMSWLFFVLVVDDWFRGLVVGLLIGTGFLVPTLGTHYLFMGYGPELIWIDGVKEVFASGITGIILAYWRAEHTGEAAEPAEPA